MFSVLVFLLSSCVHCLTLLFCFFFFKQKTAYEMRISDWSSDVCSSDLGRNHQAWVLGPLVWRGQKQQRDWYAGAGYQPLPEAAVLRREIGRASCRERVCQYV